MPFSPKTLEEKPYNTCITCGHIGKNCDGPNFLAMDMHRIAEWCRLRKDYLHKIDAKWKNEYIAERARLAEITVSRFLSGKADDTKMSTVAGIVRVLVNGSWGQYPCAMSDPVCIDNPALIEKVKFLEGRIEFLTGQIDFKEKQMLAKDKLISEIIDQMKRGI